MNTRVRFVEVIFMVLLLLAFGTTGVCIMQGYRDYAMLSLVATSLIVLIEFYFVLTGNTGKVIDLRGATNRQKKSYGTVEYGDTIYEDEYGYSGDASGFSGEGVGNMRIYQRGEKIDYTNSEEDW